MTALPRSKPVVRFVDIAAARAVRSAIEMSVSLGEPTAIVGPSGTGKSSALQHYAPIYRATYCECADFNKTTIGVFRMLIAAYRLPTDAKHAADMADILYNRLAPHESWYSRQYPVDPPQPLFIDEWQTLEPSAQRELLRLTETCRIPLVVSGNGQSLRTRKHMGALEQISTRLSSVFHTEQLTRDDAISICIDWNVEGAAERELVWRLAQAMPFRELNVRLVAARADRGDAGSIRLANLAAAIHAIDAPEKARLLLKGGAAEQIARIPASGRVLPPV